MVANEFVSMGLSFHLFCFSFFYYYYFNLFKFQSEYFKRRCFHANKKLAFHTQKNIRNRLSGRPSDRIACQPMLATRHSSACRFLICEITIEQKCVCGVKVSLRFILNFGLEYLFLSPNTKPSRFH